MIDDRIGLHSVLLPLLIAYFNLKILVLSLLITGPTLCLSRLQNNARVFCPLFVSPRIRHTGVHHFLAVHGHYSIMHGPALNTTLTTQTSKSFATAIFLRKAKGACQMFEDRHKNLVYNDEIPFTTKFYTFSGEKVGATSVLRKYQIDNKT